MERPDQKKFEMFIAPLVKYDQVWQKYAQRYGYVLEFNSYRKPGRLLKSCPTSASLNISYIIDLYMEPIWFEVEYADDLPYKLAVCAFYDKSEIPAFRWRLAKTLIENTALDKIGIQLPDYLNQAFMLIDKWTPNYVNKYGEPIKKLIY